MKITNFQKNSYIYPIENEIKIMKPELCKKCGGSLKSIKKCRICNKPNQFSCIKCHFTLEEQLHLNCKPSELIDKITK